MRNTNRFSPFGWRALIASAALVAAFGPLAAHAAQDTDDAFQVVAAWDKTPPDVSPLENIGPDTSNPAGISPLMSQSDGWRDSQDD